MCVIDFFLKYVSIAAAQGSTQNRDRPELQEAKMASNKHSSATSAAVSSLFVLQDVCGVLQKG